MLTITLRPKDPNDVAPEELEPLAAELRAAILKLAPDVVVRVDAEGEEHRIGVTFLEIVHWVIDGTGGVASLVAIHQALKGKAKEWLKKRSAEKADRRPRIVSIYGPDGSEISRVTLDDGDDEPRIIERDDKY